MGSVSLALQVLTFPLRLRPFLPPPQLLRKLGALRLPLVHPPLRQRGVAVRGSRRGASLALTLVRSPPPSSYSSVGGAPRVLASGGASDSAVSSLPGVGVAGSFRSQESVVFAAPSSVASSASAERDRRSCSREVGGSTEDRYHSRSSWSSPSRGRDSCGEHRCAHSRSGWSRALSRESCSRSTDRSLSRGCGRFRRDSSHYPSARMRSRRSRSRLSNRYRSCRVRSRSQQVRSRSSHHGARRDRLRSHRSCYQSQDWSLLSSDRSQSRDRSWRPGRSRRDRTEAVVTSRDCGNSGSRVEPAPAVASSSIPRPTPSLPDFARLFLSLSGSLAQRDAVVGSLFSAVGVTSCLVLLLRRRPQPPLCVHPRVLPLQVWFLPLVLPLRPVQPVSMSALGSLPALSGTAGACPVGRGPARIRSVARVGLLPQPALPVWPVRPPPLCLHLRMQAKRLVRCLLPPLDVLAWVVVALRVAAWHLAVTVLLSLALRSWVRDCGLCQVLASLTRIMVVALLPLLRARRKTTALVLPTQSIWIETIRLSLCFASSEISTVSRNWQV